MSSAAARIIISSSGQGVIGFTSLVTIEGCGSMRVWDDRIESQHK